MPSLQHTLASRIVPLLRRNLPVDDLPSMRAALTEANRTADEGPPRKVRRGHEEQITNDHGFPVFTLWAAGPSTGPDAGARPDRTVFWLHGGAYIRPVSPHHWRVLTELADRLGAAAVLPAYPLAPEHTVEDSFEEMVALFEEVAAASPGGVTLMGDSSGGGYALALAQVLRDRGGPQPDRMVLLAPWVDLAGITPGTRDAAERDPWLSFDHLSVYAGFWGGTDDPEALAHPRLSPLFGDLHDLPPTLMFCGTRDLLQPGCDALFERAEAADWSLEYVVAPGLIHVYPLLPIPEARTALAHIVEFCS